MRWFFQPFESLKILWVKRNGEVNLRKLLNLRVAQEQIVKLLGPQVIKRDPFSF